jgi:hypothetical protein
MYCVCVCVCLCVRSCLHILSTSINNRSLIIDLASSENKTIYTQITPTCNSYSYNLNLDFSSPLSPLAMKSYRGTALIPSVISSRTSEWNIAIKMVTILIAWVLYFASYFASTILRRVASIPDSYSGVQASHLGPGIGYAVWDFSWFSLILSGKSQESTSNWGTTASFHILSNSLTIQPFDAI